MNRSLKLSILMALALGSTQAAAVQLGQAQVKSALGQPLLVEIPVTQVSAAELQSLSAKLASSDQFTRAGISGGRTNLPLQFSVGDANGHKVIRITTSTAVDDPYLDLLVEVTTSNGSSVREVAILLDPPNNVATAPTTSAPASRRASTSNATGATSPSTVATPRHATASANNAPAPAVKNGQYGPIERGQTLSAVARATAPQGIDINQMMLALKSANPDAFYRDNINALKTGTVLRVPSRDDALATAAAAAATAVHQQNSDWRSGAARTPVSVADAATRSSASTAPSTNSDNGDKLALVPAGSDSQSTSGAGGKRESATAIHQELQRSQEQLTSLQQQGTELKSRLKDVEDINSKNQRLLSLKDNEIAELQQKLAAARKAAGLPAAPAVAASTSAALIAPLATQVITAPTKTASSSAPALASASSVKSAAPVVSASTSVPTSSASASAVVTTPLKPVAKPIAKHVARPIAPVQEEPWYMQTWAMAAGAGVVVLLLLLAFLSRRGKTAVPSAKAASPASLADRFGTAGSPTLSDDPDQDELLDQLAENPDDIGLHLELVSLYYTRRDVDHFEAAAEAMHAHISDADQPEWQDVVHMGEDLVPGHPLFAQGAAVVAHADHDNDRYGYADTPVAPLSSSSVPPPLPSKVSEYHFDFNLTPSQVGAKPLDVAPVIAAEEPASSWRFDEPAESSHHADAEQEFGDLHDDPIDTKLDLARAYLDMGDPDGARAMLDEVLQEGNQMQKDVAKGLVAKLG